MQYKKLGITNLKVSVIGLGTMTFGEQNSESEAFELMNYANEKGVNFIDTAEIYPVYPKKDTCGKTEEIIGNWIKTKKNREKIIISSKIASNHPAGIGATKLSWIRKGGENLCFDKENTNRVFLYEIYKDKKAFDVHIDSSHYINFNDEVTPWVKEKLINKFEKQQL